MLISNHMRIHELIMRKSRNDQRLRQLQISLNELQRYAEHIADAKINLLELVSIPSSMFNRQLTYQQFAMDFASQYADTSIFNMTNTEAYAKYLQEHPEFAANQGAYEAQMYNNYYEEGLKAFRDHERELIHEQEGALKSEKDCLLVDNEAIKTEVEDLKKQRSEEIKSTFSSQA